MIGLAKERFTKNLWTERESSAKPRLVTVRDEADQARYVVERVLADREGGTLLKQQAVLFRTSSHSGPLEIELTRRNIPFVKFGGLKFLDAAHIKDMLALLRFVENPRDRVAGFRVLQLLAGRRPRVRAARARPYGGRSRSDRGARAPARPAPRRRGLAGVRQDDRQPALLAGGRPSSSARGCGTSRIWSASTRTPKRAAPISSSSSRSPPAIPRANAS